MHYYDYLITKPKIEESDQVEDLINPKSKWVVKGSGAPEFGRLNRGDRVQIERKGYFIVDSDFAEGAAAAQGGVVVLINIPDGKSKLSPLVVTA
jgi:glutamyl-tRNA synthetase